MVSREAARWAWCARAVFRAVTGSTAAARPGDGASSLRRIFDVTESAASGGLRGCRPWVSVRRSPRDATKVDSGCGHDRARRPLASFRPAIGARGFASAAEAAPVPPAPPPLDAESSPASGTPASSRKRVPKPRSGGPRDSRDVPGPRSSSAERPLFVGDVSDAETRAGSNPRGSTRPQTQSREKKARETHEKRLERQNARAHRRATETARRLRSKKRQSLIGIQTWIAQNPDRLDRFTTSLACRLLAQHASRAARRARDEADGVYSLRGGVIRVRVEPTRVSTAEGDTNEEDADIACVASRTIHGAIRRVAGEATNAHEWSRLLDGAATLARAGVTCDDSVTVPVDSASASFSQTSRTTVDAQEARTSDVAKRKPPRGGREKEKTVTLSEAAVWHVTARGSTFASAGSPADVVNNLKALATIAQSYPGSVCASGARAVAQAAYARAVEWSDFELESALRALDRLVAFVKKEETYLVDPRTVRCSFSEAEEDAASVSGTTMSEETEEKPCAKKKRRRKKKKTQGASASLSPSPFDGPVGGKQSLVTRHAFAEGFDATRALVRAVAAARADGTLMSVARPRGGARNANGGVKGTDTGTLFARRRRSKPKPDKRKAKSDDAPSAR